MRELYEMEFIGDIKIEDLNPVVIIADLPDEEFLPFIKEEIRSRKFQRVKYYSASKLPPEQIKHCYERQRTY